MKIRTITLGLTVTWASAAAIRPAVEEAARMLRQAQAQFQEAGYEVQTLRLSLPPFLAPLPKTDRPHYLAELAHVTAAQNLEFVGLGCYEPDELDTLEIIQTIAQNPAFNLTTRIGRGSQVLAAGVRQAAEVIGRLALATPNSLCNFRYAAAANCPPGIPFFPASFQSLTPAGQPTLALGLQMPDLIRQAVIEARPRLEEAGPPALSPILATRLSGQLGPLETLARQVSQNQNANYLGLDLSPAPLAEESIVAAFEETGLHFGDAGTLALAAAITQGLKETGQHLQTVGYNGLMLPVLEDTRLGERVAEGGVDLSKLLAYSAVCGTGLDVVPLPGDLPVAGLQNLLYDLAALSTRYQKPLSARLFPVPGGRAGQFTRFDSPYLTNTVIMSL